MKYLLLSILLFCTSVYAQTNKVLELQAMLTSVASDIKFESYVGHLRAHDFIQKAPLSFCEGYSAGFNCGMRMVLGQIKPSGNIKVDKPVSLSCPV